MSLADELWDEWGSIPAGKTPEAECAGLLGPRRGSLFETKRLWAARRLLRLWRQTSWYAGSSLLALEGPRGSKVAIRLPAAFNGGLDAFSDGLARPEERWAWLRGLWGSCGSLYFPRSGWYLAMRAAPQLEARVRDWSGIPWASARGAMVLRDQEKIVTFLCNLGLQGFALKLEERAILRSIRDQANRLSNCDTANIRRTLRVAERQTRLARRVADGGLLPLLPQPLKALAEARLANPELSLSELGEKLLPPIRKSTVKYRWERLNEYVSSHFPEIDGGV